MADSLSEQSLPTATPPPRAAAWGAFLLAAGAALVLLAGLTLAGPALLTNLPGSSPRVLFLAVTGIPIALIVSGLIILRWPESVAAALVFCCVLFNETIERVYVPLGFFRLYPQDVLLAVALFVAVVRVRAASPVRWSPTPVGKWMIVAILFAAIQTLRGMALGNDFNAAFGELRRGYFYMIVYFLVLAEGFDPRRFRWLHRAFLAGSIAIVCRGLYRLALGRLFQMSWFDVFHVLGHGDLVFVTFLAYYCLARLVFPSPRAYRWPWLVLFPVALGLIILGNFRASWIGFVFAGGVGAVLLPRDKRRVLVIAAVSLVALVGLAFYGLRNVRIGAFGETVQEQIVSKFEDLLDYENDPNIIWRIHSYRAGWRIWCEHPVLGAGLGRRLAFHSINASGQQTVHFDHRVHNSLLWVGFSTGVVGLLLFLLLHGTYFMGAARRIRVLGARPEAGILLAYIAFYVAFMTVALFDVVLEVSPTVIALYAHMAIVRRLGEFTAGET